MTARVYGGQRTLAALDGPYHMHVGEPYVYCRDGERKVNPVLRSFAEGIVVSARPVLSEDRRFVTTDLGGIRAGRLRSSQGQIDRTQLQISTPILRKAEGNTQVTVPVGESMPWSVAADNGKRFLVEERFDLASVANRPR